MNTLRLVLACAALGGLTTIPAFAQGTAFTYQGVLSQDGAAVNGSNDLTFTLYNAASAGATVGTSNVVNDLAMSNGLFTVTLDFGTGAFDGSARWLQIAARPGASTGAFTNLAPRTPITATPYAVYSASAATAGSASSVAASNITGTIDDGRLSANLARLNVGNTFSESQTIRTSAGGLVISSSTGGQFGSGTLRVQGNTGLGADPHPLYRLFVAGNLSAASYVGDGSQLANVVAETYLGPVADSQLSPNIARRANGNAFTGNQVITGGSVGIGTATPNNLLDVAAGGVIGNSTVAGLNIHDALNQGTKVSFGYNILGSEFNGMRAVVNPGTECGNSGDLLFNTWACDISPSREVMRINGQGNVGIGTASPSESLDVAGNIRASGTVSADSNLAVGGNVGIGQNTPGFPLTFANVLGDKIALYENVAGQPSFGFGIQGSLLQIHTSDAGSDVAFGYGTSAAMTETMRIKGNGKVGIGTVNPISSIGYPVGWNGLHTRAPGGSGLNIIQGTFSSRLHLRTDNNIANAQDFIIANGANRIDFQWLGAGLAGGPLAMTIATNGNVGIGTSNPTDELEVAGNARINGKFNVNHGGVGNGTVVIQAGASENFPLQVFNQSGNPLLQVTTDTSAAGYVLGVFGDAAKSLGGNTWSVFSDERLKHHIRPYEHGLDAILKLRTKRFEYIDDPVRHTTSGHEEIGLIAQQVEGIIPEAVSQGADGYRTLNASPIYWAAINAIQELNGKVEVQRQANAKLQEQNQSLEQRVAALEKLINRLSVAKGDVR